MGGGIECHILWSFQHWLLLKIRFMTTILMTSSFETCVFIIYIYSYTWSISHTLSLSIILSARLLYVPWLRGTSQCQEEEDQGWGSKLFYLLIENPTIPVELLCALWNNLLLIMASSSFRSSKWDPILIIAQVN